MVKFTERFESIDGVKKAIYIPNKLHLTIFFNSIFNVGSIKKMILDELDKSNLRGSVETMSFYED